MRKQQWIHPSSSMSTETAAAQPPNVSSSRGATCRSVLTFGTSCAALARVARQRATHCTLSSCPGCLPAYLSGTETTLLSCVRPKLECWRKWMSPYDGRLFKSSAHKQGIVFALPPSYSRSTCNHPHDRQSHRMSRQ